LTKVFADGELKDAAFSNGSALANETYAFQVAYRADRLIRVMKLHLKSDLADRITIRTVGLAPSELPCYHNHDDRILRDTPGLYPDPLYPITPGELFKAPPEQWRSIWVTVELQGKATPGKHAIEISFENGEGERLGQEVFELEVVPAALPDQNLIHTEWFHTDCLATYYGLEVFSEEHWTRIEQYVQTAVKHGMNMLLTPLFTPPLDTEVGGERPTVQLVDVVMTGKSTYQFGFDRLSRWVDMCNRNGIKYFEFSHFFTQWGAYHAPKIVAIVNGTEQKIFGWDTDAAGEDYRGFLAQFLPALIEYIRKNGLEQRSYFHISDEPKLPQLESYESASRFLSNYLEGFPIIDALSNFEFYEQGLVKNPIPANNHIAPFIEHGVEPLWTYYCCSQFRKVSNRFFNLPSSRNRILGMQLYKFRVAGFLHWGYNFWYSQYSKKAINPFVVTDAGLAFPSGDAFLVYPGDEGPLESIRMEVFYEALQDLRALQLLEEFIGRDSVLQLLEEGLEQPITFDDYPLDHEWLLAKREQINGLIRKHSAGL
jgi:hypothetical protein